MRIIAKKPLRDFWEQYPDAQEPLEAWYYETVKADWSNPQQIKNQFRNASIIADNRVIANIKGNDYRLIVKITLRIAWFISARFTYSFRKPDEWLN